MGVVYANHMNMTSERRDIVGVLSILLYNGIAQIKLLVSCTRTNVRDFAFIELGNLVASQGCREERT